MTIARCRPDEFAAVYAIINEAAAAYRGVIAADRWKEPYMPAHELRDEIAAGVVFWGAYDDTGMLDGVMGLQRVEDVSLIRHAYTRPAAQRSGIGSALLDHLRALTDRPMLVGTWRAADWAVRFYQARGFRLVPEEQKAALLRKYWTVPPRQIAESVVLAEDRFMGGSSTLTGQPAE